MRRVGDHTLTWAEFAAYLSLVCVVFAGVAGSVSRYLGWWD